MTEKTKYIPDFKDHRKDLPVTEYKDAKYLYFPTVDLRCPSGETCVVENQYVKVGELIGTRHGGFFEQPIYSTVSGKVMGVEKKLHGSGQEVDCLIVENDFKYELHESCKDRTDEEIEKLTREDFVKIMEEAGLAGLGGGAFPTFIKYKTNKPVDYILANGVECEPFIISDYQIMIAKTKEITEGLVYAMRAVDAKHGVVVIKDKYPHIETLFNEAFLDYPEFSLEVIKIKSFYPQGWELQTIKSALGINIPVGDLTVNHGVIVSNISTLYGVYSAVRHRVPFLTRFFSIAGEGIKEEKSFLVRIGTPVKELIELCGGYTEGDKVLVNGGPMMGTNLTSDDFLISQTTTSLIVLNDKEIFEAPCVNCASCVYSCPVDIQPVQIMNAFIQRDQQAILNLEVDKCIECGLCSFTCPSKIHLTDYMRKAKKFVE